MPRTNRNFEPSSLHHVCIRGNDGRILFKDDRDRRVFKNILRQTKRLTPFDLQHYCLMNNHVHFQILTRPPYTLSPIMKFLNQQYSWYHKHRYGRVGYLYQSRYWESRIHDDSYASVNGHYIELNPCRAGLVAEASDHMWSSYRHYALGIKDDLVDDTHLWRDMGETDNERRAMYVRASNMWKEYKKDVKLCPTKEERKGTVPA